MEKSTEPNESLEEKGIKEASEINAAQEEKKSESTTPDLPKNDTIVTKIDFDKLELEDYSAVLKKMIHSDQWIKRGKEIQEVITQFEGRFGIKFDTNSDNKPEDLSNRLSFMSAEIAGEIDKMNRIRIVLEIMTFFIRILSNFKS